MNDRRYDEQDGYILRKVKRLEKEVVNIIKYLNEIEKHLRDIDMDVDDLFDEIEGNNENCHK